MLSKLQLKRKLSQPVLTDISFHTSKNRYELSLRSHSSRSSILLLISYLKFLFYHLFLCQAPEWIEFWRTAKINWPIRSWIIFSDRLANDCRSQHHAFFDKNVYAWINNAISFPMKYDSKQALICEKVWWRLKRDRTATGFLECPERKISRTTKNESVRKWMQYTESGTQLRIDHIRMQLALFRKGVKLNPGSGRNIADFLSWKLAMNMNSFNEHFLFS